MALFHNLGVNLRDHLCDVLNKYVFSNPLILLILQKNTSFLDWKPARAQMLFMDEH